MDENIPIKLVAVDGGGLPFISFGLIATDLGLEATPGSRRSPKPCTASTEVLGGVVAIGEGIEGDSGL